MHIIRQHYNNSVNSFADNANVRYKSRKRPDKLYSINLRLQSLPAPLPFLPNAPTIPWKHENAPILHHEETSNALQCAYNPSECK